MGTVGSQDELINCAGEHRFVDMAVLCRANSALRSWFAKVSPALLQSFQEQMRAVISRSVNHASNAGEVERARLRLRLLRQIFPLIEAGIPEMVRPLTERFSRFQEATEHG